MFSAAASPRGLERVRRVVRIVAGVGGAALVVFHGWLLAGQIGAGRMADAGLALRWVLAAALAAGFVALYRSGESAWGRKGIAIWVLAALLHGPAVAAADRSDKLSLPEAVATVVLQIAATTGSIGLGLWLLGRLLAASRHRPALRFAPSKTGRRFLADPHVRPFSPRPPPSLVA
ncbi:MAG: hypothetical protein ACRD2N_23670 [Vicinamibacterales bacterium]